MPAPPVVMLTGSTGFIGRHAVGPLAGRGAVVHAVSRAGRPVPGATPWAADLFDPGRVAEIVRAVRPTHLLHLAWDVTPGRFWSDPNNLAWVAASLQLTRIFIEAGGQRIVAAGTCAEYDWTGDVPALSEGDAPVRPATLYGVAKDAVRRVLGRYCEDSGVEWAWGRVFNPYGPGEPAGKLVASVVAAVRAGQPAACSAGAQERDYLYVVDVADAFAALTLGGVTGCVNVGSGAATTVGRVARLIGDLAGRPELIRLGDRSSPAADRSRVVADIRRLTAEVGWRPSYSLERGIAETLGAAGVGSGALTGGPPATSRNDHPS